MAQGNPFAGKARRGPRRINDTRKFDQIIGLRVENPSLSVWAAIVELVRRDGTTGQSGNADQDGRSGQSENANVHRIYSKYREQQYDPARAGNAPLRAEELDREGFIQDSQAFIDQGTDAWSDMGPKGYFPIEQMPDGRWKVQRHLRGLRTFEELCAECAPYFASIAALGPIAIDEGAQAEEPDQTNP
jgi:hypothetical protein